MTSHRCPGSRWWRLDLHTHTPASPDWRGGKGPDWPARWLEAWRDAGVDAVAITDHNTAGGIGPLQQALGSVPGAPILIPGVELTASDGSHLLFLFDPSHTDQHVDELLSRANIPVSKRGTPEARSDQSVEQLLGLHWEGGPLALGAHVNCKHGLLEHDGQRRIQELKHRRLLAAEVVPNVPFDVSWLDGRPEIGRVIAPGADHTARRSTPSR